MAGAAFVRADLHVHTFPDVDAAPAPDIGAYLGTAEDRGVGVLAITDHNTTRFVEEACRQGTTRNVLVLPGIEITTHDGHLLAIFAPEAISELQAFGNAGNLNLTELSTTERRSNRSMLDLVNEVHRRGGLAIAAHVDGADGIGERLRPAELAELIASEALSGLEFMTRDALTEWFTDRDSDTSRRAAWQAQQAIPALRDRGLARVMSSDAHSPDKVGRDRDSRTLTRLRLDDLNFTAVANALHFNPKGRCKAEIVLPASYPRVLAASCKGGFLDGVTIEFSPNLTCLIGGRGSGKSTALLAVRAALGADLPPGEDPDEADRMPDETTVRFIDSTGSERTAVRRRGEMAVDPDSNSAISLQLADLGQDESGRLARGYEDEPSVLLEFLDSFVATDVYDDKEATVRAALDDNANEVRRTAVHTEQVAKLQAEHGRLEATLRAAQSGKVEAIAEWAALLAAQAPLLARIEDALASLARLDEEPQVLDIDALASEFGVDLSRRAKQFVDGSDGLRARLATFADERRRIRSDAQALLNAASRPPREALERWEQDQRELEQRLNAKQKELEAQGLKVQAGAVREIADRLNRVKRDLVELRQRQAEHQAARSARRQLLRELHTNRELLFQARRATMRKIVQAANEYAEGLTIHAYYEKSGQNDEWIKWLSNQFGFRTPRVQRLAAKMAPAEFAEKVVNDAASLLSLTDVDGSTFFTDEMLKSARTWATLFLLETMRLEDRPRIDVQEKASSERKPFDRLSAGQQRSVLLSLLLCAARDEPLVIDQPEDHLDARYISTAVVRHLERAKEGRQVIIATHSANLTVLGDAELVVPLRVEDGLGRSYDAGAVDRPSTRARVCELLEGGVEAYERRGQRYGFRFAGRPPSR